MVTNIILADKQTKNETCLIIISFRCIHIVFISYDWAVGVGPGKFNERSQVKGRLNSVRIRWSWTR